MGRIQASVQAMRSEAEMLESINIRQITADGQLRRGDTNDSENLAETEPFAPDLDEEFDGMLGLPRAELPSVCLDIPWDAMRAAEDLAGMYVGPQALVARWPTLPTADDGPRRHGNRGKDKKTRAKKTCRNCLVNNGIPRQFAQLCPGAFNRRNCTLLKR